MEEDLGFNLCVICGEDCGGGGKMSHMGADSVRVLDISMGVRNRLGA